MANKAAITKLHNHHYKAVEMMLRGMSKAEVARKLGMSRQSVTHWSNHEPLFIEEYQRRFSEIREYSLKGHAEFIEEINGKGRELVDTALQCLAELMVDPEAQGSARVAAARVILERFANEPKQIITQTRTTKNGEMSLEQALKMVK